MLRIGLSIAALLLTAPAVVAQEPTARIVSPSGQYRLVEPVALALSPSGSRFAVADRHSERVFVFDSDGRLVVALGEQTPVIRPSGIVFQDDLSILVFLRKPAGLFRLSSNDATVFDTLALAPDTGVGEPDRIERLPDGTLAFLSLERSRVWLCDELLQHVRVLADQGQGRGRLWSATDIAVDWAGRLLVSDARNFPLQTFAQTGQLQFVAGWNERPNLSNWEATAVAVDRSQTIWLADSENLQFRLYDANGMDRGTRPFPSGISRPIDMAFAPDNRLVMIEERGSLIIAEVE